jgi:ABC-type amino acid transport substrate-binding protein
MRILFLLVFLIVGAAQAAESMAYIFHHDESEMDVRNEYVWRILRTALDRTVGVYGPYKMAPSVYMNEARRIWALEHDSGEITLSMFPARADLDAKLIPVRIPVDLGLLGYRILLIREGSQPRFSKVKSLADLAGVSFGLGQGWDDVAIMQNAGLSVVQGGTYEGLFRMLAVGRFDALSRSASEVVQELEKRRTLLPNLVIEKHLLLHYPLPAYFWFPKTDRGRKLADRLRAGLEMMVQDGTLRAMFDANFGAYIAQLDLAHRRIIELPNPFLGPHEPLNDARLWYHP